MKIKVKIPKPRNKEVNDILISKKGGSHKDKRKKTRQEENYSLNQTLKDL